MMMRTHTQSDDEIMQSWDDNSDFVRNGSSNLAQDQDGMMPQPRLYRGGIQGGGSHVDRPIL